MISDNVKAQAMKVINGSRLHELLVTVQLNYCLDDKAACDCAAYRLDNKAASDCAAQLIAEITSFVRESLRKIGCLEESTKRPLAQRQIAACPWHEQCHAQCAQWQAHQP